MTKSPPRLPFATENASRFQGSMRHYHRASCQQAEPETGGHAHKRHRREASAALRRTCLILGTLAFIAILGAVAFALSA